MGFNSVVFICNDGMGSIDRDPKGWWKETKHALAMLLCGKSKTYGHGHHANAFQAVWNQHADMTGVIIVGQNQATVFGTTVFGNASTEEGQIKIMKEILKSKGYRISKHG